MSSLDPNKDESETLVQGVDITPTKDFVPGTQVEGSASRQSESDGSATAITLPPDAQISDPHNERPTNQHTIDGLVPQFVELPAGPKAQTPQTPCQAPPTEAARKPQVAATEIHASPGKLSIPILPNDATLVLPDSGSNSNDATIVGDEGTANVARHRLDGGTEAGPDARRVEHPSQTMQIHVQPLEPTDRTALQSDQRRYELGEDFARGGLGKIRRALDKRIQREVAYKELLPRALSDDGLVERFLEEAQITGQLEHPSIVPIYDLGWQDDGTPYYAMKFVRGETFRTTIENFHALPKDSEERRLAFAVHLRSFLSICNAIAFAHHRGVLHRDLKPHNVMIGQFGETLVLDWGLAKIIGATSSIQDTVPDLAEAHQTLLGAEDASADSQTIVNEHADANAHPSSASVGSGVPQSVSGSVTGSTQPGSMRQTVSTNVRTDASKTLVGSIMGTPSYMPPEQARGALAELDMRADVYSLGAILYELLTNQPPITKGKDIIKRVEQGLIKPPRAIDPTISPAIAAIAMKSLSHNKEHRHETALALADDVQRFLADEPTSAYAEPWQKQLRRWVKRNRTAVISSGVAAAVLAAGTIGIRWIEAGRVARLQAQARQDLDAAQSALARDELTEARAALDRVTGLTTSETALASFTGEVQLAGLAVKNRADEKENNRLAALRKDAEQKLSEAGNLEVQRNLPAAVAALAAAMTSLDDEQQLAGLRKRIQERRVAVEKELARQRASQLAIDRFNSFETQVEQARFFASNLVGESLEQSTAQARQAALRALALYGADRGQPFEPLAELSAEQNAKVSQHLRELWILLAVAERTKARQLPPEQRPPILRDALEHLKRGDLEKAPSQTAMLVAAVLLDELGQKEEAHQARVHAETLKPETATDFFLLAQHEQNVNRRYGEAIVLYQRTLNLEPDHFLALYALGVCNLQQLALLGQGAEDNGADVTPYLSAAVTAFSGCLAMRPDFPWSYLLRGVAYHSLQRYDEAYKDFALAEKFDAAAGVYDTDSFRFAIHMNRGTALFKQNRLDEAEAEFKEAGTVRIDSPDQAINLAKIRAKREQFPAALAELQTAANRDPRGAVPQRLRGDVYLSLHALDPQQYPDSKALEAFQAALDLEPSPTLRAQDFFEVGKIHFRAKRFDEALEAFDASLDLVPDVADVNRLRGETLLELKEVPKAIVALTKYLKLSRAPHPDAYRARGLAYARIGKYREATQDYTRAIELDPTSANMHTRLGWAYLLQGDKLAEQDFDAAIAENPENGDSYNGRGFARVKQGRHAEGVADAEAAAKAGPDVWATYFNAAGVYAQALPALDRDLQVPDAEKKKTRDDYAKRAIELLKQARDGSDKAAFAANAKGDPALDPLRDLADFKALVQE